MRQGKRLLSVLLLLCMIAGLGCTAYADYGYTVRVFAGNQGTINGQTVAIVTSFSTSDVTVNENVQDKYYVKGIRESGRGGGVIYTELPDIVRDQDYVVVYGLKVDAVTLTILYQDANGNTLLASRQYYGNVGDKPQVKAAYVEGYTPTYRYITGTLSGDATWVFTYNRNVTPTPAPPAANTPEGNAQGAAGNNEGSGAVENNNPQENTDTETEPENPPEEPVQEEILDLDTSLAAPDSEAPSSQTPDNHGKGHAAIAKAGLVLGIVLLFVLICILYWYFLFYRKKKISENTKK